MVTITLTGLFNQALILKEVKQTEETETQC